MRDALDAIEKGALLSQDQIQRLTQLSLWIKMTTGNRNINLELETLKPLITTIPILNKGDRFTFKLEDKIPKEWLGESRHETKNSEWAKIAWRPDDIKISCYRIDYHTTVTPDLDKKTKTTPNQHLKRTITVYLAEEEAQEIEAGAIKHPHTNILHLETNTDLKVRALLFIDVINTSQILRDVALEIYPGDIIRIANGDVCGTKRLYMTLYNCKDTITLMDPSINAESKSAIDPIEWLSRSLRQFDDTFVHFLLRSNPQDEEVVTLESLTDQDKIIYTFKDDPKIATEFRGLPLSVAIQAWNQRHRDPIKNTLDTMETQDPMILFLNQLEKELDKIATEEQKMKLKNITKVAITNTHTTSRIIRHAIRNLLAEGIESRVIEDALEGHSLYQNELSDTLNPNDAAIYNSKKKNKNHELQN